MRNTPYIPIVSSEAGSCLTSANWQEVHVDTLSYYLEDLLLKPGLNVLMQVADLKQYLGWSGQLVLNAKNLVANKEGTVTLISSFDGSKSKFTYPELAEIIQHLKPDAVLLPKKMMKFHPELWTDWPNSIQAFFPVEELQEVSPPHGLYFTVDTPTLSEQQLEQLEQWSEVPRYMTGAIHLDLIKQLQAKGIPFIESNLPAADAFEGLVYGDSGSIDLRDASTAMHFTAISEHCACPTCSQKLTQAYLHHLLLHTPLLCQRFLIQHNVYQAQSQVLNQ